MSAVYYAPTKIYFGRESLNCLESLVAEKEFKKLLLVYDKGIKACGIVDEVQKYLRGVECVCYDGIVPNPTEAVVKSGYAFAREMNVDGIVAIGGGSSIDTAKAINVLLGNGGEPGQYKGNDKVKKRGLPLLAIPTTAGTSSELTNISVLVDEEAVCKYIIGGENVGTDYAIVDPLLTIGLPAGITAATGIDALTHAIESYVSNGASNLTRLLSLEAAKIIYHNLPYVYEDGKNVDAREEMMRGCIFAGLAFNSAHLGSVHSIAHVLSAHKGLSHGEANAVVLPYVMKYNAEICPEKYKELGNVMGCCSIYEDSNAGAKKTCLAVQEWVRKLGIKQLRDYGITREDFDILAADSLAEATNRFNPRKLTKEEFVSILEEAF